MPIVLSDLLSQAEVAVLSAAAADLPFEDGARTCAVPDKVQATLLAHPGFRAVACPRVAARLIVSRTAGAGNTAKMSTTRCSPGRGPTCPLPFFCPDRAAMRVANW